MIWGIIFISLILIHFGCGAASMFFIFKHNPIKTDFEFPEILVFIIFGPILMLVYGFCYFYLWVDNKIKKRNERKTKV